MPPVDPIHEAQTVPAEIEGSGPNHHPDSHPGPDGSETKDVPEKSAEPAQDSKGMDRADTQDYGGVGTLDLSDGRLQQPEVCWHPAADMVMATPSFPGWKGPEHVVPLKDYLGPNFQQGLDPEQDMQPLL